MKSWTFISARTNISTCSWLLEMALQQPEIRFDTIAHSTGIETIEKARSQHK